MAMLFKYGMTACKPLSVPLEQNVKLSTDIGDEIEDPTMFRNDSREFDLHDYHKARLELCCWSCYADG